MRHRKRPILAMTILVCSLGAVCFMTYQPSKSSQAPDPQKTPETGNQQVQNQKPLDAATIHDQVQGMLPATNPNKPHLSRMEGGMQGNSGPIALKTVPTPAKPVYMPDSATAPQWYSASSAFATTHNK